MTFASLFSGVGGFDLGLEAAGFDPLWFCEKDEQCRMVLRRRWPNVPIYEDVTALDASKLPRTDVLAGGSPCQGFSVAGLRKSLSDDRSNLCLQFVRICDELNPRIIIWENVPGCLTKGKMLRMDRRGCGCGSQTERSLESFRQSMVRLGPTTRACVLSAIDQLLLAERVGHPLPPSRR